MGDKIAEALVRVTVLLALLMLMTVAAGVLFIYLVS